MPEVMERGVSGLSRVVQIAIQQEVNNMFAGKILLALLLSVVLVSTIGCGGVSPDCGVNGLNVGPSAATVNHAAAPPGNSQVFSASFQFKNSPGCPAITAALVNSNWAASDPSVHLST